MSVAKISEKSGRGRGEEEGEVLPSLLLPLLLPSPFLSFASSLSLLLLLVSLAATRQGKAETPDPSSMALRGRSDGRPSSEAKAGELGRKFFVFSGFFERGRG